MVLTGTFQHTIDSKHRVAIPKEMRAQIQRAAEHDEQTVCLYVTLGEQGSLAVYTEPEFDKRGRELDQADVDDDELAELLEYERLIFSLAHRVETDKQGRIRLPEQLLQRVELGTEVVLIGVKDHIEIRSRDEWMAKVSAMLNDRPDMVVNPRRALRRRKRRTDD